MKISSFSIRRPVFTIVTMFLVLILGIVSFINIPLKLIPDINPPVGVVVTNYQGASPDEVVDKISKPLEESLSTLEGIDTITSTSQEGASLILMQFSWTTKIDDIQNEIQSRIADVPVPDDADKPRFLKFDPAQFPIIQLSLTSDGDRKELQQLTEDLEQELTKTEGVANVNLSGLTVEEVKVELNEDELKTYQLSQSEVVDAIRANVVSMPGDPIITEGKQLTTRVISAIDSVETLKQMIIAKDPSSGDDVRLSDLAAVALKPQESDTITRANQQPSILLSVLQQSDANTAAVSKAFQENLDELLKNEKYESIAADVLFDQGDYVDQAIGNMLNTLMIGGILAMIVLFVFLRNVKSPLIIGIAIPYSVIVTFVLMYFSKFSLNIMTLGGLALGIGMLVDNAIVVIENIYRHLSMGKDPKKSAYEGAREMGPAIIASTLTTVAVFLPVVFITGIIGELFTEFALTIAFSLLASLFVALTIVPMLASRLLKRPSENLEEKRRDTAFIRRLDAAIRWTLRNRALVLILTLVLFGASLFGLTKAGALFLPNTDEGFFTIDVELENGSALETTEKTIEAIEEKLEDKEDVELYVSLIGSTQEQSFRGTASTNIAEVYVKMAESDKREISTFDFIDDAKKEIESAAHGVNRSAELSFNVQSTSGSSPNTVTFNVRDTDAERLKKSVSRVEKSIAELGDVTEVTTDLTDTIEEIQISVDRKKAADQGLAPAQIGMIVADATRGTDAFQLENAANNEIYNVSVSYSKDVTENIADLANLQLKKPDGTFIPLKEVASIETGEGPSSVQRINKESAVQFTVKFKNSANLGDVSNQIDQEIEDLKLPDETDISFSGDRELLQSSIDDMILAFVLAVVFIYIVMAAQFESFKYPFVIMFTVPLMMIGVAAALLATGTSISLTVIIGIIVLAGIVVNNAIVIVDYINQKKAEGYDTYEALVESVKVRIRPILMTALTTILGLIPLALGIGEGTEINRPMGLTVIGGLISSTFLTLFVIPIIYSLFDKETRTMNRKLASADGYPADARAHEDKHENQEDSAEAKYSQKEMVDLLEQITKLVKEKNSDK
ncbi:efflux RND transporter permease subunit [Peribacillus frigoritolerans]|uniref:efflux RND transporter permease subunit n=1 Tax=Peribacillus frigoritolerans TaxID=450367 RepID=UPI0010599E0D|nr:efflux RND transporter permease subunit [Peribacillus frigoritolerans]TDL80268.1 efflux RND transporter permease subunit [Peribacillus frigoritolerans]